MVDRRNLGGGDGGLTLPLGVRGACSMLRTGSIMRITRGIMLPGAGGELHSALRQQLRTAERAGYVECVGEGVTAEGRKWEDYQLTELGLCVAGAIMGREDRRTLARG